MSSFFEIIQFQPYFLNDYYIYLVSTHIFLSGGPIYGITEAFIRIKELLNLSFHWGTGYSYPPPLLFLFLPLSFLPSHLSGLVWFGLNCMLYVYYIRRINHFRHSSTLLPFFLTFLPVLGSLYVGQINIAMLWLLTIFLGQKNEYIRGILLGVLSVIKPHLLLLIIPEAMTHKYRSVLIAVVTCIGLLFLTPSYSLSYITDILPLLQSDHSSYFHLQSFHTLIHRMFSFAPHSIFISVIDISIPLILFIYLVFRKNSKQIYFLWLTYVSLFAGLNSFINFTLLLPAYIYLLDNRKHFSGVSLILYKSIFAVTNGLFVISILAERLVTPHTVVGTISYAFITSLGCISSILLFVLLLRINNAGRRIRI